MSLEAIPVVIANGQSLSAAIDLGSKTLVGIQMPAAWTSPGGAYGQLSFQASFDGATFANVFDDNNFEFFLYAAAPGYTVFRAVPSTLLWLGVRWLKVRAGLSGSPVNQDAERTIQLLVRPLGCSVTVNC